MTKRKRILNSLLPIMLLAGLALDSRAKSYSSGGGHSYSSHSSSSHSSSFGSSRSSGFGSSSSTRSSSGSSSKSFNSGSGKSYSSGSTATENNRQGYSSSKSYTSGSGLNSAPPRERLSGASGTSGSRQTDHTLSSFDTGAARARKEEASRERFSQFKQSQGASATSPNNASRPGSSPIPYADQPRQVNVPGAGSYSRRVYVPNVETIRTRPVRIYNVFNSYSTRPWVTYRDPYPSFFWWWLLDRSLDDRAYWAYHHRYDMDPLRYQALVANDQQLQARVSQLETEQTARDPNYVPPGLDRDLMYSDQYINRGYHNRPTTGGAVAFWVLGVPLAVGFCAFFIWLIWFKRWQTAT